MVQILHCVQDDSPLFGGGLGGRGEYPLTPACRSVVHPFIIRNWVFDIGYSHRSSGNGGGTANEHRGGATHLMLPQWVGAWRPPRFRLHWAPTSIFVIGYSLIDIRLALPASSGSFPKPKQTKPHKSAIILLTQGSE